MVKYEVSMNCLEYRKATLLRTFIICFYFLIETIYKRMKNVSSVEDRWNWYLNFLSRFSIIIIVSIAFFSSTMFPICQWTFKTSIKLSLKLKFQKFFGGSFIIWHKWIILNVSKLKCVNCTSSVIQIYLFYDITWLHSLTATNKCKSN